MNYRALSIIIAAHPKLFKWEYPPIPSENPRGWGLIVDALCTQIEDLLDEAELAEISIVQMKEKMGGLRFYCENWPDDEAKQERLRALIKDAERKSFATCRLCGCPGDLRQMSWLITLCNACAEKPATTWWDVDKAIDKELSMVYGFPTR